MGADLILTILCGPKKLRKSDVAKAKKEAKAVIEEAKLILKRLENNPDWDPESTFWDDSPLRHIVFHEDLGNMGIDTIKEYLNDIVTMHPSKVISDIADWWANDRGRDTCSRWNPHHPKHKIVCCGDTSYGDSPSGYGWTMVRYAEWFNALNILGIH